MTLAALAPVPGQLLWDVGAGCGSIGIEWMRSDARCRAIAIEPHPTRLSTLLTMRWPWGRPISGLLPERLPRLSRIYRHRTRSSSVVD